MPIGAIIGGVASIGGAILSSSAQKKAANQAANVARETSAENNALSASVYNQNAAALNPFQQRGNAAGDAYNSLLGLGSQQQDRVNYNLLNEFGQVGGYGGGWRGNAGLGNLSVQSNPQADYNNAFQNYQNSTGYQFRMGEGVRAIDAGAPVRNSGATLKARQQYGQNLASNEFGNYLGQLANQQSIGLAGASAQAGVGQNYVNNVTANNNSAGNALANAALMRGQANQNMYGGIANGLGSIFGSSFRG